MIDYAELFSLKGKVAVVTGGAGGLGAPLCRILAEAGARVAVLGRSENAIHCAVKLRLAGHEAHGFQCDVTDVNSLSETQLSVEAELGDVDILVNCAGGNRPGAITSPEKSFFDLDPESLDEVFRLNFHGTLYATQVFARSMIRKRGGSIINIGSMAAIRPISRVVGYSAAKAAVTNLTQWLAVHMAREYHPGIRVNALAPGFFVTEQNRRLLIDETTGELTARGRSIIDHTPIGRFGEPEDLASGLLWLASPSARFVTGVVLPIDGGFSAYSGV